ncbi:MAG: DUF4340 domain-containing protein [Gammaproteobacteria bacterium]
MKQRKFALLALVTLLLITAALYVSQQTAPQTGKQTVLLFPEVKEKINDIDRLHIQSADSEVNILQQDGVWVIAELDNYVALFDKVKQTVVAVSELKLLAEKTTNAEHYARLGVEDISADKSNSRLLTLNTADTSVAGLIVGRPRHSKSPSDQPGLYVRLPDSKQALLVAGRIDITARPADWFERNILDINSSEVKRITIQPQGQAEVLLSREAEGAELLLANVPEDKSAQAEAITNQIGTLLEGIYVESVKRETGLQEATKLSTFTLTTFKGLRVDGQLVQQDEKSYVLFAVSADEPPADADADKDADEQEHTDTVQQAETLNQSLSGWGYELPGHKTDLMSKTIDDLTR